MESIKLGSAISPAETLPLADGDSRPGAFLLPSAKGKMFWRNNLPSCLTCIVHSTRNTNSPAKTLPLADGDGGPGALLLRQGHVGEDRRGESLAKSLILSYFAFVTW